MQVDSRVSSTLVPLRRLPGAGHSFGTDRICIQRLEQELISTPRRALVFLSSGCVRQPRQPGSHEHTVTSLSLSVEAAPPFDSIGEFSELFSWWDRPGKACVPRTLSELVSLSFKEKPEELKEEGFDSAVALCEGNTAGVSSSVRHGSKERAATQESALLASEKDDVSRRDSTEEV